jgi:hypothetical protein
MVFAAPSGCRRWTKTMTRQEFMALHRHYIWGLVIRKNFEVAIKAANGTGQKAEDLFVKPFGAYMFVWYGMLYGILEVLKKKRVSIPAIQTDIDGVYDSLRLCRNAVFHPQPEYFSPKLFKIMEDQDAVNKIWRISKGLGKFFLDEIHLLNAGKHGVHVED